MKIKDININNFRNIEWLEYDAHTHLNVFTGNNAQGKTNIIEAIFLLATGTSFRSHIDAHLLNFASSSFYIKSRYQYAEKIIKSEINYEINGIKTFKINSKKTHKNNIDRLRVVLFTPDDLYLIKGSPIKRRNFIDFSLKQISSDYNYYLDNYTKILKKRNFLLKKEQTNSKTFKAVNEVFLENAARVIIERINFVTILDQTAAYIYKKINGEENNLKIRYALSFPVDSGKINLDIIKEHLEMQLKNNREKEINRKRTLVGPHLDDINIYQDNRLARLFASQGQQRNIAVSLKLAEIYTFKKIKNFYPVFLLDEVLAELDENKKELLIDNIVKAEFQSFLTSVNLSKKEIGNAAIFIVENGNIKRKE